MIKLGQILKLAAIFRFSTFLSLSSEAEVESALRKMMGIIPQEYVVQIFDLWQSAKESRQLGSLENFSDQILSQYAESLEEQEFNTLSSSIDIVISDAEQGSISSLQEDVESASQLVDYQQGQEIAQETGGRLTEGDEKKRERAAELAKRYRELLPLLKERDDYDQIKKAVSNGISNEALGITKEQWSAILYDINRSKNLSSSRVKKLREIKRLMQLGLSREQAEKKYEELSTFENSEDKIQGILERSREMGENISEDEIRSRIQQISDKDLEEFKRKTTIPLTQVQKNKLSRNLKKYIYDLMRSNPEISEDNAKEKAKQKFNILKRKIKPLSVEETDKEIDNFLQELKQA